MLKEQMDNMKKAFLSKITETKVELENVEINYRRKMYRYEEELKEVESMKNVFLKQVITYQNKLKEFAIN